MMERRQNAICSFIGETTREKTVQRMTREQRGEESSESKPSVARAARDAFQQQHEVSVQRSQLHIIGHQTETEQQQQFEWCSAIRLTNSHCDCRARVASFISSDHRDAKANTAPSLLVLKDAASAVGGAS